MKRLLLLLLISIICSACPAMAQQAISALSGLSGLITITDTTSSVILADRDIHEREIMLFGINYIVRYEINFMGMVTVPATNLRGKPHYSATIEIWRQKGNIREKTGASFSGEYVDGGCFEDDPEMLVRTHLRLVSVIKNEILRGLNLPPLLSISELYYKETQ